MQKALAPLFSALLESIALELIEDLARKVEAGSASATPPQSWRQLAAHYGENEMKGIWQSTKAQIVFGGVPDADMLRDIEALFGETMERAKSRTRGTFKLVPGSVTTSEREVHRLPMEEIYDSEGKAFLFYRGRFTRIRPALYFSGDVGRPFYGRTGWAPGRA